MTKRRLSMRKIEEVLRLKWGHQLSNRQIANSCLVSHTTVREYLDRARVGRVLASAEEAMGKRYALRARGVNLAFIASRISQGLGV
jgi:predicted DNA-binding protein (UPF0251 family)